MMFHGRPVVVILAIFSMSLPGLGPLAQQTESAPWAEFGVSVATTTDTIFVAANPIRKGKRDSATVHVFQRHPSGWRQVDVISVPEAMVQDSFGISMAADDATLVVGAQFADGKGEDSGLAYVFERRNGRWNHVAALTAADTAPGDQFGLMVSLSGETIVVGSRLADVPAPDAGAAYIFARRNGTWQQIGKLTASDAASGDLFGRASIDANAMVVSADLNDDRGANAGKAYAFRNREGRWVEEAKFTASDGTAGDEFGLSLALKGNLAGFGAIGADGQRDDCGAAYVFERRNGRWTQAGRLTASGATTHQVFGSSVAIGEDTIVVGAPNDGGAGEGAGAAYVFERSANGWTQAGKLIASDAAPFTGFGSTVAISGNRIVVGMLFNGKGQRSGAAYVFERTQGRWSSVARLVPSQ